MSEHEVREKRSRSRKKNIYAKALYDQGDYKGAFALKVVDPRKGNYKREKFKINVTEFDEDEDH